MSGFSLNTAVELYENANIVDEILETKHKERLWREIQLAIQQKRDFLDYTVPKEISWPVVTTDRAQIIMYLVRYCRSEGFTVEVVNAGEGIIRVKGWAEIYRQRRQTSNNVKQYLETSGA